MIKAQKTAVASLIRDFAYELAVLENISLDKLPSVVLKGTKISCRAYYDLNNNNILIRPMYTVAETICHEMAHWLQFMQRGKTDCKSTPIRRRNFALAAEHAVLEKVLLAMWCQLGYNDKLLNTIGDSYVRVN